MLILSLYDTGVLLFSFSTRKEKRYHVMVQFKLPVPIALLHQVCRPNHRFICLKFELDK